MKICTKCGLAKDESEFHRQTTSKDGLKCWCKKCSKKIAHDYYLDNQKLIKERASKWKKDNPKRKAESAVKYSIKQRAEHPERKIARNAVNNALRDGRLKKEPCLCGKTEVEGHHENYSKPLEIEWMCVKCHITLHSTEAK